MAFECSVIHDPTGTTTAAVAMAALALSVVAALAGRAPRAPAAAPMPPVRQAAPCSHHGVEYFYAMDLREAAEAQPLPRAQSELWKQAALAFDEIAAQPDLCAATRKRAAHSAIECWKHLISDCRRWDAQVPDHRSTRPALPYAPRKLVAAIEVYRGDASVDADDDYLPKSRFVPFQRGISQHDECIVVLRRTVKTID